MTTISDPTVAPIAATLVACLAQEAAKVPDPPATPRVVCLRPGDHVDLLASQTEDECCSGLMWVRWSRIHPSAQSFPSQDGRVSPCDVMRWAVTFELGAVRCSPIGTSNSLPTCDDWEATTLGMMDDGAAIRRALCCFQKTYPDTLMIIDSGMPLTTEGGCTGVVYTVIIAADSCDCEGVSGI